MLGCRLGRWPAVGNHESTRGHKAMPLACFLRNCLCGLGLVFFGCRLASAEFFTGETFNICLNYAPADINVAFVDANPNLAATFNSGGRQSLGVSLFNPAVEIFVEMREIVISPTNSRVIIQIAGFDALGNFANPIADGSLAVNNQPFTVAAVDLGIFNAAGDTLAPSLSPFPTQWSIDPNGFIGLISTQSQAAGFPIDNNNTYSSPPAGIAIAEAFNFNADVATVNMSTLNPPLFDRGGELAGWVLDFNVTSVPEPSAASLAVLAVVGFFGWRRRSLG